MKSPIFHSFTPPPYSLSTLFCLLLILAGCPRPEPEQQPLPKRLPMKGVTLRLAVVDDPALAAAVVQARGEWNAQTGAEFEVVEVAEKELERAETLPADAVICPSHLLGVVAERDWIEPVPEKIVRGDQWGGIFDLPKLREADWGGKIVAVPFGSPVFCCYYRADLLERLGRRPPRSWSEYHELAAIFAKAVSLQLDKGPKVPPPLPMAEEPVESVRWSAAIEPLAPGWAGLTLLARAAPSAKHRDNFSAFFDIDTMEPSIAEPPFVQALEELAAAAKLGPGKPVFLTPAGVRAAFWRGECALAVTWPTAGEEKPRKKEKAEESGVQAPPDDEEASIETFDESVRVGFAELPGSTQVYNSAEKKWDKRADGEDRRVPLLAVSGRLGAVNKSSTHKAAAFQLLLWLSDEGMSPQISALSPATTMFRRSNMDAPGQWVEEMVPNAAAAQYAAATQAAFTREQWLTALPIPGRAEYLAVLDEAVAATVRGEKSAKAALEQTAVKWREITKRLGLEKQKAAYRHSVGL